MGGTFTTVYSNLHSSPSITSYLATGLTTAHPYRFKVIAYNYNGAGAESAIATFTPCSLPTGWVKPSKVSTTTSTISISWSEPTSNGGCPITGYAVFIDDGANGAFVEANSDIDTSVRGQPSLSTLTITRIPTGMIGSTFRVKVLAYNAAGYLESPTLGVILASLPLQPPTPTKVAAGSSSSQITIDISAFPSASNGGCSILSYNI